MRSLAWLAWAGVVRGGDADGRPGDTADGGCAPEVDSDPRLACDALSGERFAPGGVAGGWPVLANGDDAGRLLSQGISPPKRKPQATPAPQGA
jgi:hypothetical protein